MASPGDWLIQSTLLPDHAHDQTHTEHDDDQRRHHLMHDQVPRAQERSIERARNEDAARQEVGEGVGAERGEMNDGIVDDVVDDDGRDGKVMNEQTTPARCHPRVVKDENVSLDGRQGEQSDLHRVDSIVDIHPDDVEDRRSDHRYTGAIVVKNPGYVGELVEQADEEEHDDDVIVQGSPKCSIGEKGVEHEEGGNEG